MKNFTIDTATLKENINLVDLVAAELGKGNKRGGWTMWKCPFHPDSDPSFGVGPENKRYKCFGCGATGDAITFVREYYKLDFAEACTWLDGGHVPTTNTPRASLRKTPPTRPVQPPGEVWQAQAGAFAEYAQEQLWSPSGRHALDLLLKRGLTTETILWARLGYNPNDIYNAPERWGVTGKNKIWLPAGIVIPWFIEDSIWRINIRRLGEVNNRYIGPAGWAGACPLHNADEIHPNKPVIIVEGEFCALTVRQEAGDMITPVATGSTTGARADKWYTRLSVCPLVLGSTDATSDGDIAAEYWLKLPNAKRWRPTAKDVNDMLRDGQDVRAWIASGLGITTPPADDPLWQTCLAAKKSYPVTMKFPDGTVTYRTPEDAYSDLWTRSMVQEAISLGGVVAGVVEDEEETGPEALFDMGQYEKSEDAAYAL